MSKNSAFRTVKKLFSYFVTLLHVEAARSYTRASTVIQKQERMWC